MKKFVSGLIVSGAVSLGVVIVLSIFGAWLPVLDSIAHFRFHLLVLLGLSLVPIAMLRMRKWLVVLTCLGVAGVLSLYPAVSIPSQQLSSGKTLKLIQFNTLFSNPSVGRSLQWVLSEKPDFVMMQEVSSKTLAIYDGLANELPHGIFCKFATVGGVAVRSRYPMKSSVCKEKQGLAWLQADVDGKPMTLSSIHLHWPYPYGQWQQLKALDETFKSMPRPVLLTGDFNAAPWSAAVSTVARATDTWVAPGLRFTLKMGGAGIGPMPFLPIDHILLPESAHLGSADVGPSIGSDHLPVVVTFSLD